MNEAAKYLAGIMSIILFWLFVGSHAASMSDVGTTHITAVDTLKVEDAQEDKNVFITVPNMMLCSDIKTAKNTLYESGMRILSTGITISSNNIGEEIVEIWLEPKSSDGQTGGKFAVLRIMPRLGMSCVMTSGPKMVPGGTYAEKPDIPSKDTPAK